MNSKRSDGSALPRAWLGDGHGEFIGDGQCICMVHYHCIIPAGHVKGAVALSWFCPCRSGPSSSVTISKHLNSLFISFSLRLPGMGTDHGP